MKFGTKNLKNGNGKKERKKEMFSKDRREERSSPGSKNQGQRKEFLLLN